MRPIFGILVPGERTTRKLPAELPEDHAVVLQNSRQVVLIDQSKTHITVENRGTSTAPYLVIFVAQDHIKKAMAAKQIWEEIRGRTSD